MSENEILVGLDIGTTKIVCIVGVMSVDKKIEILGFDRDTSKDAVLAGEIINIDKAVSSIIRTVSRASSESNVRIKIVHVGIAGKHITSFHTRGQRIRDNSEKEITKEDIDILLRDMYNIVIGPSEEIIHIIPQKYTIDGKHDIKEPIGMQGAQIEGSFHIVTGNTNAIRFIGRSIQKAGLEVDSLTLEPIASAEAVLTEEEKEEGVILIDIGGGTTDLAIFQNGILVHTSIIPMAGEIITSDIKKAFKIMPEQAEKLKIKFGQAIPEQINSNEFVKIDGKRGFKDTMVSIKNLSLVINSRLNEIFENIIFEIKLSGYKDKILGGIVLTGGSANLNQLPEFAYSFTKINTRIGLPNEFLQKGYNKKFDDPSLSTAIGLLINGFNSINTKNEQIIEKGDSIIDKLNIFFEKIRKWLGDDQKLDDFEG